MTKNIVVLADGTWNKATTGKSTNVVSLRDRLTNDVRQRIKYDPGVGSGTFFKITGGAFGVGISKNIRDLYQFIISNYTPGDRLYFFGFSRGAFTVRSLVGMILTCGILKQNHIALADRAFQLYKKAYQDSTGSTNKTRDEREANYFKSSYSHGDPEIRVIGVWDTVGALGVPFERLNKINPFSHRFHDTKLSPRIKFGFHAISIDEKRQPFKPTLWSEKGVNPEDQTILQTWFPGVHSDIGGGYDDDHRLSDVTLSWMIDQLEKHDTGVLFNAPDNTKAGLDPNHLGKLHDSYQHIYKIWPPHHRTIKQEAQIHDAAYKRTEERTDYMPPNLPKKEA